MKFVIDGRILDWTGGETTHMQFRPDKMPATLEKYVFKFSHLKTDRSPVRWGSETNHRAPHKPLLLLAVLDQFAENALFSNLVEPSVELIETFASYWARVMSPNQRGYIVLPFFHLTSDEFWHLLPKPSHEAFLTAVRQIHSLVELKAVSFGARLDDDLYALLTHKTHRDVLRQTLIETYFSPSKQAALLNQSLINDESFWYSQELFRSARQKIQEEKALDGGTYQIAARDQGFRRAVVTAYKHTCAFCGLRVLTSDGHTATDAAHIVPWSKTRNDAIENGLALCKLCHWGFDEGLLAATTKFTVITSPQLSSEYNISLHLQNMKGQQMTLPNEENFWPSLESLKRHREETFRSR